MIADSVVLDLRAECGFTVSVVLYRPETPRSEAEAPLTLVLAHAAGLHKELWQPVLEHLFRICPLVLEAWAIGAPRRRPLSPSDTSQIARAAANQRR